MVDFFQVTAVWPVVTLSTLTPVPSRSAEGAASHPLGRNPPEGALRSAVVNSSGRACHTPLPPPGSQSSGRAALASTSVAEEPHSKEKFPLSDFSAFSPYTSGVVLRGELILDSSLHLYCEAG